MKYRIIKEKNFYMEYSYFIEEYIEPYFFGLFGGYWKKLTEWSFSIDGDSSEDDKFFKTISEAEKYLDWKNSDKVIIKTYDYSK